MTDQRGLNDAGHASGPPGAIGPFLILDDIRDGALHLSALFFGRDAPGPVVAGGAAAEPAGLYRGGDLWVWRARFRLPASGGAYRWNGETFDVAGGLSDPEAALRIGYVSCNGEEHGDLDRDPAERNAMWMRLAARHAAEPLQLLLHGGDQIYADEVTHDHDLTRHWPERVPEAPSEAALADLRSHLSERFVARYAASLGGPAVGWLMARVPSLMQWDDHDICDGWGSLPDAVSRSAVGWTLFSAARQACLTVQHAAIDGDLPPRFADPSGRHLGWSVSAPGLRLLAPDLRSERTRHRVMGEGGWAMMEREAQATQAGRTILMSSVPLLGPRLSILERLIVVVPRLRDYEDDLRDQWQSRAHRDEWRRMLRLVRRIGLADGAAVTAVSGEIHLASRASMGLGGGRVLHQLVASGISHRAPPKGFARALGALSRLGEDPLPEHPIRIHPLPGTGRPYAAERNALLLARDNGVWTARWDLEDSGPTPAFAI